MKSLGWKINMACAALLWGVGSQAGEVALDQVTLFTSGVGYFEHQGRVIGEAQVSMTVRDDQLNDVIKSLVAIDRDGGTVGAVSYAARDPLERILSSFAVDLTENPSLADIAAQLRGVLVRADLPARSVEGRIVGTEERVRKEGDMELRETFVILNTDSGLQTVRLDQIQHLAPLDEAIARDLEQALDALAEQVDQTRKTVRIGFTGEGERRVSLGYLLETPMWKTSYRIVIDDEALWLQGWGYVENMTDMDWNDVQMALVSGRPISFIQNLYDPIYIQRPVVAFEKHEAVAPQEYAAAPMASPMRMQGVFSGKSRSDLAPDMEAERTAWSADDMARQQAQAEGEQVGELFQYPIAERVSIPRQSSAMLPIVQTAVEGAPLSIYTAEANSTHPLNGVELENTSGLFLMQGPVTVFQDGVYAGDARMPDTAQGATRLLSYAVDLAMEVVAEEERTPRSIVKIKVVQGALEQTMALERTTTYRIISEREEDRTVLIEHPRRSGWTLLAPTEPAEQTADQYRFRLDIPQGESIVLDVIERRVTEQTVEISDLNDERIAFFLRQPVIGPEMKDVLEDYRERRARVTRLQADRRNRENRLTRLNKEQEQTRANMKAVQSGSDSFVRFEKKLIEQADEIDRLNEEISSLRREEAGRVAELENWLANLNVE